MKMTNTRWGLLIAALLLPSCAVRQDQFLKTDATTISPKQSFEPTVAATRRALREGKITEALAFHEGKVFDYILGTHPISTKGTTAFGRSEATKRF
jgi:hypothetical protein